MIIKSKDKYKEIMKNINKKLLMITFSIIVFLTAMSFGIYAALNAALLSSGTVKFNAYGIDADVEGTITGAVGTGITTSFSGTTNKTRQPGKDLISSTPWNFGNLGFDEENAMSIDDLIIEIEFKISNYSNFPIEASLTVPTIAGVNFDKTDMNYNYRYDSSLGADERFVNLVITPVSLETPVNITNLNFTLNIFKSTKKEAEITKFLWGTPASGKITLAGNNLTASDTEIIIPRKNGENYVNIIGSNSFGTSYGVTNTLISIVIPNSVTKLDSLIFQFRSNLTSVSLPESITEMGMTVFYYCSGLIKIRIPTKVTVLNQMTFSGTAITRIKFPPNLTILNGFEYCSNLRQIKIPNTVIKIGSNCFNRSGLTTVTIPSSVATIDNSAFDNCSNLSKAFIERAELFTSLSFSCFSNMKMDSVLYFKNQTVMNQFTTSHYTSLNTTKALY